MQCSLVTTGDQRSLLLAMGDGLHSEPVMRHGLESFSSLEIMQLSYSPANSVCCCLRAAVKYESRIMSIHCWFCATIAARIAALTADHNFQQRSPHLL